MKQVYFINKRFKRTIGLFFPCKKLSHGNILVTAMLQGTLCSLICALFQVQIQFHMYYLQLTAVSNKKPTSLLHIHLCLQHTPPFSFPLSKESPGFALYPMHFNVSISSSHCYIPLKLCHTRARFKCLHMLIIAAIAICTLNFYRF